MNLCFVLNISFILYYHETIMLSTFITLSENIEVNSFTKFSTLTVPTFIINQKKNFPLLSKPVNYEPAQLISIFTIDSKCTYNLLMMDAISLLQNQSSAVQDLERSQLLNSLPSKKIRSITSQRQNALRYHLIDFSAQYLTSLRLLT